MLGFCHCHEHLMLRKGRSYELNPALCIDDLNKTIDEVSRYKRAGGNTIIEAQPCGCGRMPLELIEIARQTHINLIASTGFHKLCFYPENHWIRCSTEEQLYRLFKDELTFGMYTDGDIDFPSSMCSAKAGIIKTAYDKEELSPRYRLLFTAAIRAALDTDRRIMVHIEQGTNPLHLLEFMSHKGMPLNHLIFCHMDRACEDLDMHQKVASKGVYLEYDTIGRFKYHSDEHEINLIKKMIQSGHAKKLLFSLDTTRERLKSYNPAGIGLDYILTTFIPMLKKAGITAEQLKWLSHDNCCHLLSN